MEPRDYLSDRNGLFHRATEGRVYQILTAKKLQDIFRQHFSTANTTVSNNNYFVALNVPFFAFFFVWISKRKLEQITLEWLRTQDPYSRSVKILRTAKGLEKEQAALL